MIDHVGKCWMQRVNARWRYAVGACTTTLVPPKRLRRLDWRRRIFSLLQRAHCLLLPQICNNQPWSGIILGRCLQCALLAIGTGEHMRLACWFSAASRNELFLSRRGYDVRTSLVS